jgi:hypothetical protein
LETVPILIFGEQIAETAIIHARREMRLAARIPSELSWEKNGLRPRSDGQSTNSI